MRKSFLYSTVGLIGLAAFLPALAGNAPETIVVSATRLPTPVAQVASSVTVISANDIAVQQAQSLPDVLKGVPGLNIVQTGGPGGQTSLFMRGTNSNHVKVLVDGIDVGDPSSANGAFGFSSFLTPDIDRVEVLRGPQSGLYGSDAIGGVINIITKAGNGPAKFTAGVDGGSFDTFNQNGGVSGSIDGFHFAANVAHFHSNATPVTPIDLLAPGEKRNDDRYDNVTASTKLGYDVASNFDLGFVGRYTNSRLHITGDDWFGHPNATQSRDTSLQYYTRGTGHLVLLNGFLDQTVGVAFSSVKYTDDSPSNGTSPYSGDRIKVDWQGNLHFSDSEVLVLGAEHQRDEINLPISANTSINSGYVELQSNPFDNFYGTVSVRFDDNDHFGSWTTYRIAPAYIIAATGTKLKASVGTGFKAPTLSQMFQNYPSYGFYGNPDLKPETSTGWDVGFEQPLFENVVRFGATYFRNDIKNLIGNNATYTSYTNIGKAKTEGVESFISLQPIESVTLRLDYTYTKATDEILHLELLRRPQNKFSVDARWQITPELSVDANLLTVGPWIDGNRAFTISRMKASGYTTVDVGANYDITDNFTVYGRINNLLDEDYQNPVGFLRPGRGFFAGVKAKI
jgi:vitamin B12 transporter